MGAGSKLRQVLAKNGLVEAMAAHSPLSAMLAAEAGFDAIWASGFELSAMYGVPDVSVVSMVIERGSCGLDYTRRRVASPALVRFGSCSNTAPTLTLPSPSWEGEGTISIPSPPSGERVG